MTADLLSHLIRTLHTYAIDIISQDYVTQEGSSIKLSWYIRKLVRLSGAIFN